MLVVAALDEERQTVAQRAQQPIGPGAQRQHGLLCFDAAFSSLHRPTRASHLQGASVPIQQAAAALHQQVGVALHQRPRIAHGPRVQPVHRADQAGAQRGFGAPQGAGIFRLGLHAKGLQPLGALHRFLQGLRRAKHEAETLTHHQILGACSRDQ